MKYLKPLMLVIAGFAIAMLVSFKSEEPKKEYATLQYSVLLKKIAITITFDNEAKKINSEHTFDDTPIVKELNLLAKEGWVIITTEPGRIYLERTKQ